MKELTIPATVENIEKVTEFVNGQLEEINCPIKAKMLDERCRALVILKYYRRMSLKDIASRMGISYASVKILHKSALNKLKNHLSG